MSDLDDVIKAYVQAGGDKGALADPGTAHLVAHGHSLLSSRDVPGLTVDATETATGIAANVTVHERIVLDKPVHLCFSMLHAKGTQEIKMQVKLEAGASAVFIAHCIFPNAEKIVHSMDATIELAEGAEMRYSETHYHGLSGGIEVLPKLAVKLGKSSRYFTDFLLTTGRVGKLGIDYTVDAGEGSIAELTARVFGHATDRIEIQETIRLQGENARGLVKARVAIEDDATAEIRGVMEGNAAGARGHVDCMEIVKDRAVARAVPTVQVNHPLAKVTHEAAIGSVDKRQLETLMAHGLTPEEATDVIVKGILR
jgi:Fe-S cluster assembly scaffold protein SufB